MILEITPSPLEMCANDTRLWQRLALYCLALVGSTSAVGAMTSAICSAIRGTLLSAPGSYLVWVTSIATIALAYALHEIAIIRLPKPQINWQVPARWSKYGKSVQLLLYGLVLGVDVFTLIPYTSFYILVLLYATLGVGGGAVLGFVYGLARVVPTICGVISSHRRRNTIPIVAWITNSWNLLHLINGVTLALVGEVLVGTLLLLR